ncbi:hypothetical protein D3C85_1815100 [compost metagenome]
MFKIANGTGAKLDPLRETGRFIQRVDLRFLESGHVLNLVTAQDTNLRLKIPNVFSMGWGECV